MKFHFDEGGDICLARAIYQKRRTAKSILHNGFSGLQISEVDGAVGRLSIFKLHTLICQTREQLDVPLTG